MDKFQSEERILKALRNKRACNFVRDAFVFHYSRNFQGYSEEAAGLVNRAFDLLIDSQKEEESFIRLESAVIHIYTDIFKKNDQSFWFNKIYLSYKKNIRPRIEFNEIRPYLYGKKFLDFGSGTTSLALRLKKQGYAIEAVDILDYRFPETKIVPFVKMKSPIVLDYPNKSVDTIMVKAVLHHINSNYLLAILKELERIGKRLIIEESVFGIKKTDLGVEKLMRKQPIFNQFLSLSLSEQYFALIIIDFFANALALGKPEINLPFEQKTVDEWKKIFINLNIKLVDIVVLGFEPERITPDSRILFICDTF